MKLAAVVLALTLLSIGLASANGAMPAVTPEPLASDTETQNQMMPEETTAVPAEPGAGPTQPIVDQQQMMTTCPSISVDARSVYVVRNGELLRFDKPNMNMVARASLSDIAPTPAGVGAGPGMQHMMCPVSTAVDETLVYVLRGNELMRYNKDNLQLTSTTALPSVGAVPAEPGAGPTIGTLPATGVITGVQSSTQQMMQSLQQATGGQFDRRFLQSVANHYAGSIAFARLAQDKATREELRDFGSSFARDRSSEVQTFSTWSRTWYGEQIIPRMTSEDAQLLEQMRGLSGTDFDIAFMHNMIFQLDQAQQMSELAQQRATRPEIRNTAGNMIEQQNREIEWLSTRLQSWYGIQAPSF